MTLFEVLPVVEIFTDGACTGNPGPGGYGVVIKQDGKTTELSQGYVLTTNNRMELMAVIEGMRTLKQKSQVRLYTDSKYISDAIQLGWADIWRAKGWRKTGKGKILNPDLWQQLMGLLDDHKVTVIWVKGHAGHLENERCDRLAVAAANGRKLLPDHGYEDSQDDPQPGLF
jgi:ribonuclease HI